MDPKIFNCSQTICFVILKFVSDIAWPIVVTIALFIFKKPIYECISSIEKLKIKGIEISFRKLRNIAEKIQRKKEIPEASEKEDERKKNFIEIVNISSPEAGILAAWTEVINEALSLIKKHDLKFKPNELGYYDIEGTLRKSDLISLEEMTLYFELKRIRNEAEHSFDIFKHGNALTFIDLSLKLIDILRSK